MKKSTVNLFYLVLLLFISCEKTAPIPDPEEASDELKTVVFKLTGFSSEIRPLSSKMATSKSRANAKIESNQVQYLYFWSFNEGNLIPEVAIHPTDASIALDPENTPLTYPNGYKHDSFPEGQCVSMRGVKRMTFKISMKNVSALSKIDFDAASSNTGPKNFKIYYAVNDGSDFISISEDNQFTNMSQQSRNHFEFDLSTITASEHDNLWIIIEPFAGERGVVGDYNEATGLLRIDNFGISGIYDSDGAEETMLHKINYYIFKKEDNTLALEGDLTFEANHQAPPLSLKLPVGSYYASFVSNSSKKNLLLSKSPAAAKDLYIANHFDNHQALIFGTQITDITVSENNSPIEVALKRYFSNVKFEFTDQTDLSFIDKIVINRMHENFIYTPYGAPSSLPVSDASMITFVHPFKEETNALTFNQFIGEVNQPVELSYNILIYGENDELLRDFIVHNAVKNNVQLLFKGELLKDLDKKGDFIIEWNEQWGDPVNGEF